MDQYDALFYTKKNPSLTLITRCCPDHVIKALATLGTKDQSEVERYRLGAFLSSTLKSPGKRDLIWWLLDNSTLEKRQHSHAHKARGRPEDHAMGCS